MVNGQLSHYTEFKIGHHYQNRRGGPLSLISILDKPKIAYVAKSSQHLHDSGYKLSDLILAGAEAGRPLFHASYLRGRPGRRHPGQEGQWVALHAGLRHGHLHLGLLDQGAPCVLRGLAAAAGGAGQAARAVL